MYFHVVLMESVIAVVVFVLNDFECMKYVYILTADKDTQGSQ